MADEKNKTNKPEESTPEKKTTPAPAAPVPSKSDPKSIQEDYRKASPKDRLKKFKVDPVTKTLRRA